MTSLSTKTWFVRVPHELLGAYLMIARNLSPYEHAAWWFIVKRTYGLNKGTDCVANSQFEHYTGIPKDSVSRIKRKLLSRNMIVVNGQSVGIQGNSEQWKEK